MWFTEATFSFFFINFLKGKKAIKAKKVNILYMKKYNRKKEKKTEKIMEQSRLQIP